ncbi:SlyX family protein [Methylomicrobium sp. Wu6]|uniref:SlyX family protein n=1 Tax=Methylomicrobium sp. Wu6 TaxID=3107928 RepID=UPI002DD66AD0|nr:SlyX family protein [Methylomicrobium sp. Wu6]MEC4749348.1 SlyX family protein [Methylomicrobium sp. Wu6]
MNEERIIELEIKAAYQEDLLQALNRIVSDQQQQIDRLEATCRLLNERMQNLLAEAGNSGETVHEIPPHY